MQAKIRLYINITNKCNMVCPFCCQYSSPNNNSFMDFNIFKSILAEHKQFEAQFEGGEPTIHPDFIKMVSHCLNNDNCARVIIQSNGTKRTLLERCLVENKKYKELVFKISFNDYLYNRTKNFDKRIHNLQLFNILLLKQNIQFVPNTKLIINARTTENDTINVEHLLSLHNLNENAVIYPVQKYGRSKEGIKPFIVQNIADWKIYASDGKCFNQDLIARSKYEKRS